LRWKFRNVVGETAAIGSAGQYTLVVDRPADGGGLGLGFNGGQLLYLAIGGCVSNDLFWEASARGINLTTVRVLVRGNFTGEPAVSEDVSYEVELGGGTRRASSCKSWFRMWTQLPRFRTQCVEAHR
jgi:putative redox protein